MCLLRPHVAQLRPRQQQLGVKCINNELRDLSHARRSSSLPHRRRREEVQEVVCVRSAHPAQKGVHALAQWDRRQAALVCRRGARSSRAQFVRQDQSARTPFPQRRACGLVVGSSARAATRRAMIAKYRLENHITPPPTPTRRHPLSLAENAESIAPTYNKLGVRVCVRLVRVYARRSAVRIAVGVVAVSPSVV